MQGLYQPLLWFENLADQHGRCCGMDNLPCWPVSDWPKFQIKGDIGIPLAVEIFDTADNVVGSSAAIFETITTANGNDQYFSFVANPALGAGKYYYKINGMYSSMFEIKSSDCFVYKYCWRSCSYNGAVLYDGVLEEYCIYFKNYAHGAPTIERRVDGKENGFGTFIASYNLLDKLDSIEFYGGDAINCALQAMSSHDNVIMSNLKAGTTHKIESLAASDPLADCNYLTTLTYRKSDQCRINSQSCCGSEFEDSPFVDPCEGSTDPGEPCPDDFTVDFEPDGNGNLIVTVNNAPSSATSTIYINGVSQGQATAISLGEIGTYLVIVQSAGCSVQDQYVYQDPCLDFNVDLVLSQNSIDASITGSTNTKISITDSSNAQVIATSFPASLPDGNYIVKVESCTTDGTVLCSFITEVVLSDDACNIDFDIIKNEDGSLTASNISGCDTTSTFIWFKVSEGSQQNTYGGGQSILPDTTGNYIAQMTCGSCQLEKAFLCIVEQEKTLVEICNWEQLQLQLTCDCECEITDIICIDCTLYLRKQKCSGFSFEWTTPWGTFNNEGPIPVPEEYHGQSVTVSVTASKDGCDDLAPIVRTLVVGSNPAGDTPDEIIDIT